MTHRTGGRGQKPLGAGESRTKPAGLRFGPRWFASVGFGGLVLVPLTGCGPSDGSAPGAPAAAAPTVTATAPTASLDEDLQQILGCIKLIREEYGHGWKDGKVANETEYAETVLFLRRARAKLADLRPALALRGAGTLDELDRNLAGLDRIVAARGPLEEVGDLVRKSLPLVESFLSSKTPPAVAGLVASVAGADAALQAETIQEQYRIGIFYREPQAIWMRQADGTLKETPADAGHGLYLGVLVRDRRTKRHLPHATVRVRFLSEATARAEATLLEIWGDSMQYGANVDLPVPGPYTIEVRVEPPDYNRHADMLQVFNEPVEARFEGTLADRTLTVRGPAVTPVDADYGIGDDLLQGMSEASVDGRTMVPAGPYLAGFVAESPEPLWRWKDGKGEMVTVQTTDTNHLEIVLLDRERTRMVTGARVTLTLKDRASGRTQEVKLLPLMSEFFHYGATCGVPPGDYDVTARIEPPAFHSLFPGRFEKTEEATFHWEPRK